MKPYEILDGVYYAGVDDYTTHLFEGLWTIPYGVSYNTYIVRGEKTALIDTVSIHKANELLDNIGAIGIDYLVVNHMEPDHSGAIPELAAAFPQMKIVCNQATVAMIKGFYHVDESRCLIIKDTDTLELGHGKTLQFFLTPMVHWPETMMTYLQEDKVLFSGDAFGTFGALQGRIVDVSDCNREVCFQEMRRYYAAIVAKYSRHVQNALAKLNCLSVDYICSTHGPVWHEYVGKVISMYDDMSADRTEKGVVIVYGSMYGNTSAVAEVVARRLAERGISDIRMYNAGNTDMSRILADIWRYKGLVIGGPTYSMNIFPPIEALLRALEIREIPPRVAGAFGSYAWAPNAAKLSAVRMQAMGLDVVGALTMKLAMNAETEQQAVQMADAIADKLSEE